MNFGMILTDKRCSPHVSVNRLFQVGQSSEFYDRLQNSVKCLVPEPFDADIRRLDRFVCSETISFLNDFRRATGG